MVKGSLTIFKLPDLCWKVRDQHNLLFCAHTLCISYYWFVARSEVNNYCVLICTVKTKESFIRPAVSIRKRLVSHN